jgi:hypothetical protein
MGIDRTLSNTYAKIQNPQSTASFAELLERAGFRVRGRRADCKYCNAEGRGRGTVAFTADVAYCHRCKWTANSRTLSRALGFPVAAEERKHRDLRRSEKQFSDWLNTCHAILARRLRRLTKRAERAKTVLADFPDCEPAWNALADFYHNEAQLLGAFDVLSFEPLSQWLENPVPRFRLALVFREAELRSRAKGSYGN